MQAKPGQISYLLLELYRDKNDEQNLFENINYRHLLALNLPWSGVMTHIDVIEDAKARYYLRTIERAFSHDYINNNLSEINLHHKTDIHSLEKALFILGTLYDSSYSWSEYQNIIQTIEDDIRSKAKLKKLNIASISHSLTKEIEAESQQLATTKACHKLIQIINETLYIDWSFQSSPRQLLNIRSHILQEIISKHRKGIPLSLSCLYIILGQRIGLPIYGVNLPRHFMVKLESPVLESFIVADNKGQLISSKNMPQLLTSMNIPYNKSFLDICNFSTIIRRMIANLTMLYKRKEDLETVRFLESLSRNLAT